MISIHAPREGGDLFTAPLHHILIISIHAPREGGDCLDFVHLSRQRAFQSTPPARGATPTCFSISSAISGFQSTPPARGATSSCLYSKPPNTYFNPRPPRGGRPVPRSVPEQPTYFNPRPPRGGRQGADHYPCTSRDFNPRPPRGGRLYLRDLGACQLRISIHAPREGGDYALSCS